MANLISIAGGGTSAATAADARTNLGLGTLATQNANGVAITGGTMAGDGAGLTSVNASNLASGTVPQARKWTSVTLTTTGNQDNVDFSGADELRCNNASLLTIRGLAAGVGGQRLRIVSVGAGQVDLAHQNTNSTAANRLINFATVGLTQLAAGSGVCEYEYDATTQRWRLVSHNQGAWISVPFNASDFSGSGSMTWAVDSADVPVHEYLLSGKVLMINYIIQNTDVGGTAANSLQVAIPAGHTAQTSCRMITLVDDAGGATAFGVVLSTIGSPTKVSFRRDAASSNWTLTSGDNTGVSGTVVFPVN